MKYAVSALLVLSVSFLLPQTASAQSKEETEKFLVKKLSGYKSPAWLQLWVLTFKKGTLIVQRSDVWDQSDDKDRYYSTTYTVKLADLNPAHVEATETRAGEKVQCFVKLHTTDDKKAVNHKAFNKRGTEMNKFTGSQNDLWIMVKDNRTANQAAKAFRHLIKLYGGKEELFEE